MVTIFIIDANHQFVNVRDLSEVFVSFGIFLPLQASPLALSTFYLNVFFFRYFCRLSPPRKKNATQSTIAFSRLVREVHWKC